MADSIRVLHIDDEPDFASLTADFLERESGYFDVETETHATKGLERIRSEDLDCVVSDHDMPSMTGIELLESVRDEYPDLPFILFTGKGSEEVASDAISAGVTDYLQKEGGTEQYTLLANRIENAVERQQSQRAVKEQKRRLETIISNVPGLIYRCRNEPGWPMDEVAGECEELAGYSPGTIESGGVSWGEDVIHPDDQEEVWDEVQAALQEGVPFELTYRIETADGQTKWVWERGRNVTDSDGEVIALEGFITDITESKRRERRFEAIFNNTYQFTGLLKPDGTIIEANEAALSFAGIDRNEVVGKPLWEGKWFESSQQAKDVAREAVETAQNGELFRDEIKIQGANEEAFVDFSVRPVTNDDGDVTLLIPEGRNISELKEREQTLREQEHQFEAIFNDPNLLVGLLDTDGTVEDINEIALEYVDASREDIVGNPFWETPWWTDDYRAAVKQWVAEAADGEYVEYEADHPTEDGGKATVEGNFRPVTDDDGTASRIIVSAKDVTQRRRRERELKRRNEQFDEFASFVSHDLQSPVSTVQGRLELALQTGEMEHVEKAAEAIDRVDELRDDLVTTLRTGEIVSGTERIELESVLDDVWTAVDPPQTASVTVEEGTRIEADTDALQRMLENLVGNSIEHGPDDVTIQIGEFESGFYYEDSGPGIDPELRDRIFTPGFSTKNGEEGIGMGMASVRQIVLAHGWEIHIKGGKHLDGVRFEITDS
ncbi:PAS domain S-box protein [Halorubrum sp. SS5]|uniref:histidine kinase n=1 Tax=Halobellus clavatus TaxID=660517 RepID=A0A1H3HEJ8_9EURY|nr:MULTISPECIES: PAS domain S-box protein [Halobacteria]TKX84927.1 PAS domain S-box protein [Halorubrum sp. SS5]SDY13891.1 PAS domain S-box-containing protein [Halobellus clavatus]